MSEVILVTTWHSSFFTGKRGCTFEMGQYKVRQLFATKILDFINVEHICGILNQMCIVEWA